MEQNRLELLQQQVEASQSLLERMTEQVAALNSELVAMRRELSVLSEAVLGLKDEEEAAELSEPAQESSETSEGSFEPSEGSFEPSEDFHDISEEEVRLIEKSEELTIAGRFSQEKLQVNLNEQFVNRSNASLSRSMSLNDRFRFQRELFHGSQAEMNDALSALESCQSFGEAWDCVCHVLDSELIADENNEALQDFRHILELHFS